MGGGGWRVEAWTGIGIRIRAGVCRLVVGWAGRAMV